MKNRCRARNTRIGTIMTRKPPAVVTSQPWPERGLEVGQAHRQRLVLTRPDEDQRHQQVVPDPEELEDRERRECRHRHREHQSEERLVVTRSVDLRRLDHRLGQRRHVVAQDVDRQRHPETYMGQPHRRERAVQAEVPVELQDRDERHVVRDDQQADDRQEQHVAARELHERERVGRERRDQDRDERRRQGDREAVDERRGPCGRCRTGPCRSCGSVRSMTADGRRPSTSHCC